MPAYTKNDNQMNTSQFEPSVPRLGGQQLNLLPWDPTQRSVVLYFGVTKGDVFLRTDMYHLSSSTSDTRFINTKCTDTTGTSFEPEGTEEER
jgi:hypothetical protein